MAVISAGVSEKELALAEAIEFVNDAENGAVDIFVGRVRNHNLGRVVKAVSYDAFVPLAAATFNSMCKEAIEQIEPRLRCYIWHHKGRLEVGGISIIIAVGAPHRDEAFRACRYLIEAVKKRSPIWKQEHYEDGDSKWTEGHSLCGHSHESGITLAKEEVAAVILSGGASRRMGRNKAELPWKGTTLAQYIADVVESAGVSNIYLSGDKHAVLPQYPNISDLFDARGPVSGICSSIHFTQSIKPRPTALLILPVDVPLLSADALNDLLEHTQARSTICYFTGHPLPCIIPLNDATFTHSHMLQMGMAAGKNFSVKDFFNGLPTLALPPSAAVLEALTNTNSPSDWSALDK